MHIYCEHKNLTPKERKDFIKPPCENCGWHDKPKRMQQHHVFPQKWNWPNHLRDLCIWLCPECHGRIHAELDKLERQFGKNPQVFNQLDKWVYAVLALNFTTKDSLYINENRKYLI